MKGAAVWRSRFKSPPMIELPGWVAVAIAWLSALWWEHEVKAPKGECFCNCTCETKVTSVECPEVSWSWELSKAILLVLLGIICATLRVISGFIAVVVKVIGLIAEFCSPSASTPSLPTSTASEVAIEGGEDQRARALRQLAVLRDRKAAR